MERLVEANAEERANLFRQCARTREYEDALLWLEEAGVVQRCFNVSRPGIPLSACRDIPAFKAYACDCPRAIRPCTTIRLSAFLKVSQRLVE